MKAFNNFREKFYDRVAWILEKKELGMHITLPERMITWLYSATEKGSKALYRMPLPVKEVALENYLRAKKIYENASGEAVADAVSALEFAVEVEKSYKEPYMLFGQCYIRLGDYATASEYLIKAKNAPLWMDQKRNAKTLDLELSRLLQEAMAKKAEKFL